MPCSTWFTAPHGVFMLLVGYALTEHGFARYGAAVTYCPFCGRTTTNPLGGWPDDDGATYYGVAADEEGDILFEPDGPAHQAWRCGAPPIPFYGGPNAYGGLRR